MEDNREAAIAVLNRLVELELAGRGPLYAVLFNDLRTCSYSHHALDATAGLPGAA